VAGTISCTGEGGSSSLRGGSRLEDCGAGRGVGFEGKIFGSKGNGGDPEGSWKKEGKIGTVKESVRASIGDKFFGSKRDSSKPMSQLRTMCREAGSQQR
jgi:hypothetical protein